ncbi:MAG: LPS export ABC transporter periplasmic protein LptC [Pseudomonadota bacterium]
MSDRLSFWFPVLLLALLAGLTFWLDSRIELNGGPTSQLKPHSPDFMVENFSSMRMDERGMPRYTLSANKMQHYPSDDSTDLDAPRFVRFNAAAAPITISSDRATVSSNGENAYFTDNVIVVRSAYNNHGELALYTDYLHVIPEQDLARTDKPVKMTGNHTTVNAIGLELNSADRTVKLLSHVQGHYENPRSK